MTQPDLSFVLDAGEVTADELRSSSWMAGEQLVGPGKSTGA